MDFEFDPGKDEINRLKHGVSLVLGAEVLMNRFGQIGDERRDYGEDRFNAFGLVNGRLFVCTYTMRGPNPPPDFCPQSEQAGATYIATVKTTPEMVERAIAQTDWAAQDVLTDEDIAHQVNSNPDAAPVLTEGETAASIVRTVRKHLGISQAAFAARYHIPVGTLRDWEQARKHPDAPALAYLRVIAKEPDITARALAAVR
jgi:putative transcriptional regulator